ncbi:MAG TPA: VOC family protein [Steroidobacteraceae bacterium]|nr:VOC family protein [Steroidobacteraceae bacterium]
MIRRIHHINFLVRDLDAAIEKYEAIFGRPPDAREFLADRGVETARFRVGETWIVLVMPVDPDSVPGQHLQREGEGFFLISYEVEDAVAAAQTLVRRGICVLDDVPRAGLEGWRLIDLDPDDTFDVVSQLTEET